MPVAGITYGLFFLASLLRRLCILGCRLPSRLRLEASHVVDQSRQAVQLTFWLQLPFCRFDQGPKTGVSPGESLNKPKKMLGTGGPKTCCSLRRIRQIVTKRYQKLNKSRQS